MARERLFIFMIYTDLNCCNYCIFEYLDTIIHIHKSTKRCIPRSNKYINSKSYEFRFICPTMSSTIVSKTPPLYVRSTRKQLSVNIPSTSALNLLASSHELDAIAKQNHESAIFTPPAIAITNVTNAVNTPAPAIASTQVDLAAAAVVTPTTSQQVYLTTGLSAITPGGSTNNIVVGSEEGNVLKKIASFTAVGADSAPKRSVVSYVPEKLNFGAYQKFEGEHNRME